MYLAEGVGAHDGKLRPGLGIVHHVEVDKFLQLQGLGLHILEHIHEKHGDIFTSCHRVNDAANGLLFLFDVRVI